jgi:hypothetical protein
VGIVFAALLPSLIVALTKRGGKQGWAAVALAVLDRLSLLAHHDAKGTVKLPGMKSKPVEEKGT